MTASDFVFLCNFHFFANVWSSSSLWFFFFWGFSLTLCFSSFYLFSTSQVCWYLFYPVSFFFLIFQFFLGTWVRCLESDRFPLPFHLCENILPSMWEHMTSQQEHRPCNSFQNPKPWMTINLVSFQVPKVWLFHENNGKVEWEQATCGTQLQVLWASSTENGWQANRGTLKKREQRKRP